MVGLSHLKTRSWQPRPQGFSLKNWVGREKGLFPPHPFFEGKALGTRLRSWGPLNRFFFLHGFLTQIFPVGGCHSASPGHTSSETLISPRTCLSLKSVLA